jgi:hypothetical protein
MMLVRKSRYASAAGQTLPAAPTNLGIDNYRATRLKIYSR